MQKFVQTISQKLAFALDTFHLFLNTLQLPLHEREVITSEIRNFFEFLTATGKDADAQISEADVIAYVETKQESPNFETINSAFGYFQEFLNYNRQQEFGQTNQTVHESDQFFETLLSRYKDYLAHEERSGLTIKNYLADLKVFFGFCGSLPLSEMFSKENLTRYTAYLEEKGSSGSTIARKKSSLKDFAKWSKTEGFIKSHGFEAPILLSIPFEILPGLLRRHKKDSSQTHSVKENVLYRQLTRFVQPLLQATHPIRSALSPVTHPVKNVYQRYHAHPASSYIHLGILVVASVLMSFFAFRQFLVETNTTLAYPSTLTPPGRFLSFQARLTDASSTPITSSTNLVFRLWDDPSAGSQLWTSGTCAITPDSNGIFSTLLGSTCGSAIASSVFSENTAVYLEVTVGAETLTPRQRIASVAYALNSETLQGFPPADPATVSTIPVVNSSGQIIIAASSPLLQSTSGTFGIKGDALSITTDTGTNGNIAIAPDGTGQVNITGGTTSTNFLNISNASLTTGTLITGSVGNNNTGYKFLQFFGGSSPLEKFSVDALGNVVQSGYLHAPGATISATYSGATPLIINGTGGQIFSIDNSGNTVIAGTLAVNGDTITSDGDLTINPAGGNVLFADGDVLNIGGASAQAYNFMAGSTTTNDSIDGDNDLYIEDELEVDGTLRIDGTTSLNGAINLGDGGDAITLSGTTITLTTNGAGNDMTFNLVDNNADALDIQQGTNNYINIATTNSSEDISFGNTTTDPTFNFLGDGNMGIGTSATTGRKVNIAQSFGAVGQDTYGIYTAVTKTLAEAFTIRGIYGEANFSGTSGTMTGVNAIDGRARATGSGGTVTTLKGVSSTADVSTGATVTSLYLLHAAAPSISGSVDTLAGLVIDNMTGASGNNYAIYSAGGLAYFAGAIQTDGDTTLGNANTDTLTINAGTSGTGISFGDSSFATCTALETVAGVLTCGSDDSGSSTPDFDAVYAQSITNGNLTMEIDDATGLTFNMNTTGAFAIQDNGTPYFTFDDDSTIDVLFPAGGTIGIDAAATDNTTTAGIINLDIDTITNGNIGISNDYQVGDTAGNITAYANKTDVTVDTDAGQSQTVYGDYIGLTANDATSTTIGLAVIAEDAGGQVATTGILIENLQATDIDLTDGLLVRATTNDSIVDAIDVSDAEITNALNVGANTITGAGYTITSTGSGLTLNSTSADLALQTTTSGNITFTPAGTSDVVINNDSDTILSLTGGADGTDAMTVAAGNVTLSNGDLALSGGDFNVNLDDGDTANIDGDGSPTADLLKLGNGDTSATDGVDALQIAFTADDASGNLIDLSPTFTDNDAGNNAETWNVIDIDNFTVTQNDSGGAVTGLVRGLNIGNVTESLGGGNDTVTSTALNIGTGWDSAFHFTGTSADVDIVDNFAGSLTALTITNTGSTGAIYLGDSGITAYTLIGPMSINLTDSTNTVILEEDRLAITSSSGGNLPLSISYTDGFGAIGSSITVNSFVYTNPNYADDGDADTRANMFISTQNDATDAGTDDNIYGVWLTTLAGSNNADGNEYGIYQEGTTWDYGIYAEDQVRVGATDYLTISTTGDLTFTDADGGATITGPAGGSLAIASSNSQALALSTTTAGDITLTTGAATGLANVLTGSLKVGNGVPTVTLNGEDAYIEGTFEVDGAVRLDNSSVTLGDASFTTCTALETVAGVLTCGSDGGGTTPDFDEVYAQSITNGNLTMEIDDATGLTFNMNTTGAFAIQDNGTTFFTFDDDSTIDVLFPAAGTLGIDAAATDNTTTAGVINLDLDTITDGNIGISNDYQVGDTAGNITAYANRTDVTVDTDAAQSNTVYGNYIGITANDATSTTTGLAVIAEDAGGQAVTTGILIDNLQATDIDLTTGLLIRATTDNSLPTAIDISDAEITTALSVGQNFITGDGIRQFSSSSTVWTFEDTSGNDLATITDAGTTGTLSVTGLVEVPTGSATNPTYTFTGENTTGIYKIGIGDIGFTLSGTGEINMSSTAFRPHSAEGNALGTIAHEWEALYVGDDNGVFFGLDQDFSLAYDEATDDRLELTATNKEFAISLGNQDLNLIGSADGTDALTVTAGDITVTNGDLDISAGDFNVTLDAGDGVNIAKGAATTVDVATINGGTSATDGVDNLQLTFGVSAASGNVIDITPSYADATAGSTSEDYYIIDIDGFTATQNASGDTGGIRALNVGNLTQTETAGTLTASAIRVGTGWDDVLNYNGTTIINGSGQVVSTQVTGTLFSITDGGTTETIAQGNTITYADSSTVNATVSSTDTVTMNVIANSLDFTHFEDNLDLDATTDIDLAANNLTIDLDSTGTFEVRDGSTTFVAFDDDSTIDVTFPAAGTIGIDAATTDNTTTAGVINLDLDTITDGNIGISNDYQVGDSAGNITAYANKTDVTVDTDAAQSNTVYGNYIGFTANDATSTTTGLAVIAEDAGGQVMTTGILIDNLQATDIDLTTGLLIRATTDGSLPTAIDISDAEITTALSVGQNFITGDGIRQFSSSSTVWTVEDTDGNDLLTITDAGTTGNAVTTGNFSVNGNTTIGNANTDTLTISAGSSGTGISFGDSSFATCTSLETVAGVLTCGTDDGATSLQTAYNGGNSIETSTNAVVITETGAGAHTHDLLQLTANASSSTFGGDALQIVMDGTAADSFTGNGIRMEIDQSQNTGNAILIEDDGLTDLFRVDETGSTFISSTITMTASTGYVTGQRFEDTANTTYFIDPASATTAVNVLGDIAMNSDDPTLSFTDTTSSADDYTINVDANAMTFINSTDGRTELSFAGTGSIDIGDNTTSKTIDIGGVTSSAADTVNIATEATAADDIHIGNTHASTTLELFGGDDWSIANTGILTLSASASQTTAIVATDTDYTNALSVGDNNIIGTTAAIDFTNFDVATTGNITTATGTGIDCNAGSCTLNVGVTNATTVALGTTAATTINIGAGGALTRAIAIGTGTGADTITIGTGGTGADVITIGNNASTTSLAFTSGTGSQTHTSSVTTGTTTSSAFVFDATAINSGTGIYAISDSITTGKLAQFITSGNTLTTGTLVDISSTATSITTGGTIANGGTSAGSLFNLSSTGTLASFTGNLGTIDWSPGSASTMTGDMLHINVGTNGTVGSLFNITDQGSSLFKVTESSITSTLPHAFTAAGDIAVAYDAIFTNQTSSYIKSNAPLYIEAGETFESNNLTLRTFNSGDIVFESGNTQKAILTDAGRLGVGVTSPAFIADIADSQSATSAAQIYNSNTGTDADGLIVKLGFTSSAGTACTTNGACNEFITFLNGNGQKLGKIYGATTAPTLTYKTNGVDFAEFFTKAGEETFETGQIVSLTNNNTSKTVTSYDKNMIGIVSENPGFVGGVEGSDKVLVGLLGQLPVQIDENSDPILRGDSLTASGVSGKAMKANRPGQMIGKALEDWIPGSGKQTILIYVNATFGDPTMNLTDQGELVYAGMEDLLNNPSDFAQKKPTLQAFVNQVLSGATTAFSSISAQTAQVNTLVASSINVAGKSLEQFIDERIAQSSSGTSQTLMTNNISEDEHENLMITIGDKNNDTIEKLSITDSEGTEVASIDEVGNATVSGTLTAQKLIVDEIENLEDLMQPALDSRIDLALSSYTPATLSAQLVQDQVDALVTPEVQATLTALLSDSNTWNTASVSGEINFENLNVGENISAGNLISSAQAHFSESLVVGSSVIIDETSLSYVGSGSDTFFIQPTGLGNLNLLANLMILDHTGKVQINGDVTIAGNLSVSENLMTQKLTPNVYGEDLNVKLASSSGNITAKSSLAFTNELDQKVAEITASGSASFNKLIIASDNTASPSGSIATSAGFNASTGTGLLATGETDVIITSNQITPESLVYITPASNTDNKVLFVSAKQEKVGTTNGWFKVSIDLPLAKDVTFNWWIIN